MKARLDRSSSAEKIITIGAGGCGFASFDRTWQKAEIKRVVSVFALDLPEKIGPIRIQGNIIYVKPITIGGRPVYYVGIQFLPEDAHRIKPVIDVLQEMTKSGEVGLASSK